jgi:hypothetical protein
MTVAIFVSNTVPSGEPHSIAHVRVAARPGPRFPSFPPKIVGYSKVSLPVIPCLETSTAAGELP